MSARHSTPPPPFDDESWLPFGNLSQKGGVHVHVDRGSFCFGARLYLGASLMYFFLFGSWCISFIWVIYVRGRHYVLCLFYCFLFHMWYIGYWFILWGYHGICLLFSILWNQEFCFVLLVFSTHAFMYLLSFSRIYRLIQSCSCLHW